MKNTNKNKTQDDALKNEVLKNEVLIASGTFKNKNVTRPKQVAKRKRSLSFEDIEDPVIIEVTNRHIEELEKKVGQEPLISLERWCEEKGVEVAAVNRLLNDANLPVIRIGTVFRGVYESHLQHVFDEETRRQIRLQIQNRMCARLLSERYQEEKTKNDARTETA